MMRRPPRSPLFPYTTLSRSGQAADPFRLRARLGVENEGHRSRQSDRQWRLHSSIAREAVWKDALDVARRVLQVAVQIGLGWREHFESHLLARAIYRLRELDARCGRLLDLRWSAGCV